MKEHNGKNAMPGLGQPLDQSSDQSSDQSVLEKVTAFITRSAGEAQELLVFQHSSAGIQIPAGTVEKGEDVEAALWREVWEETGLTDLMLLTKLGAETVARPPGKRVLLRTVPMLSEPAAAPTTLGMMLQRGLWVSETAVARGGWSQVRFEEYEMQSGSLVVSGAATGWVPSDALIGRVVRHFFHLEAHAPTLARWTCQSEVDYEFALFWMPLDSDPGLRAGGVAGAVPGGATEVRRLAAPLAHDLECNHRRSRGRAQGVRHWPPIGDTEL